MELKLSWSIFISKSQGSLSPSCETRSGTVQFRVEMNEVLEPVILFSPQKRRQKVSSLFIRLRAGSTDAATFSALHISALHLHLHAMDCGCSLARE